MTKKLSITVLVVVIALLTLGGLIARAGAPAFLPSPESNTVLEAALASDGTRLILFYDYFVPGTHDYTYKIKEWKNSGWEQLHQGSSDIFMQPDVAVRGAAIVASGLILGYGSQYVARYITNYSGSWVTGTSQAGNNSCKVPRVAFAFGVPYMSYTVLDFNTSIQKLFLVCLAGCTGLPELTGFMRVFGPFNSWNVGDAALAGDSAAVYSAFVSPGGPGPSGAMGCVNVRKLDPGSSPYLGPCFFQGDVYTNVEIALFTGYPVVGWTESEGEVLRVSEWNGADWVALGMFRAPRGHTSSRFKIATSGSRIYVVRQTKPRDISVDNTQIVLSQYNGSSWSNFTLFNGPGRSTVNFQGLAVYQDQPVVAYLDNGVLKILRVDTGDGTKPKSLPWLPLLLE